jgi:KaiC/GvpD/RAD55 family RecA-like ATPase
MGQNGKLNLERVPTGIEGFDELCERGLLRNRSYLLSGSTGTGKTIFGIQYLYNGITKYGEKGIYIATEERPDQLRENVLEFGWDLEALENEGKLVIVDACSAKIGIPSHEKYVDMRPFDIGSIVDQIIEIQNRIGAKRAVVDSTTSIGYHLLDSTKIRIELLKLSTTLEIIGLTSILTCELLEGAIENSRFGIEQFVAEGVIKLSTKQVDNIYLSNITIIKMRGSNHSKQIHPYEITSKGIKIHSW